MASSVRLASRIPQLAASLPQIAQQLAMKVGADVQAAAMENIRVMGAIDTGNMLNSSEVRVEGSTIIVIFNADYSGYVHQGTRRVPARPFLAKAADDVRQQLPSGITLDVQLGGISL